MVHNFSIWDYTVLLSMMIISTIIGLYYAWKERKTESITDFFTAGRSMSAIPVALSLLASFISAITVLGAPVEVYRSGAMFSLFSLSYIPTIVITSEIYMPVFYRLKVTSAYQYLELRFNKQMRLTGVFIFMIQTTLYTGIVIYAPALAFNEVTGVELWGSVVAIGLVCTVYCTFGGLKAVIWTDVFQAIVILVGFFAVIIKASEIQGGITTIIKQAKEGGRLKIWDFNPSPLQRHTFWTMVIGGFFTWICEYGITQTQVQRYVACKDKFQARVALYLNLLGLWTITVCVVLCGMILYSVYQDCDPWTAKQITAPDQLMPYLTVTLLKDYPGLPGLFVSTTCGATLSTVSTSITALSAVAIEDLIKPQLVSPSPKTLSLLSQGSVVFFGILCIGMAALASFMGNMLQTALSIFGMIGGPLLGLFTLGMINPYANSKGSFIGLMIGTGIAVWIGVGAYFYPPPPSRTLPLPISIAKCNQSEDAPLNWTALETNLVTTPWKPEERDFLMNYVYSLSYLYLSTLGTLLTIITGTIFSLLTGGKNQNIDSRYLLRRDDMSLGKYFFCNQGAPASPS